MTRSSPDREASSPRARREASHTAIAVAAAAIVSGCVVVPRTTTTWEPDCQVASKRMELEVAQIGVFAGCHNAECGTLLVAAGFVVAASAVVSGSIAIVGNVVYWLERQGQCVPPPPPAAPPSPA